MVLAAYAATNGGEQAVELPHMAQLGREPPPPAPTTGARAATIQPHTSEPAMTQTAETTRTWADYYRDLAELATEMTGAANHLDANPEYATDEVVAEAFRRYAERMRAVEQPS